MRKASAGVYGLYGVLGDGQRKLSLLGLGLLGAENECAGDPGGLGRNMRGESSAMSAGEPGIAVARGLEGELVEARRARQRPAEGLVGVARRRDQRRRPGCTRAY